MKLNILIPTLLSTFLSLYLASSQPLQTTITATTSAFDADGHEVQPGTKYYIAPSQSNDNGGGLSLASRDGFCPPFVVQENSQLSKGLSLRFLPLDTKQNTITMSSDLNIVFNAATICVQSTVWRVSSGGGGGSGSGTDDMVTGRRYFVRSGGVVGRPGAGTVPMAAIEQKTETDVPPTNAPKSTDNVSEVPVTAAEPKSETDVPPTSTVDASEVPVSATEPKTETDVPPANSPKSATNVSEVPVSATEPKTETDASPTGSPKSTVNVSEIKTVEVSNVSMDVKEKDIWEFFSFSGPIHYIEMKSEGESAKHAFVTYKDSQGAETAALLTGATIGALSVSVSPVENYKLPPEAPPLNSGPESPGTIKKREVAQKAEEVVSTMLAKGFVLGKDALNRAKSFDERHQLTTNASATVASLDRKMGLTQKLSTGTAVVNEKMKVVNERYQVTEKSKTAIAVAEQKANSASSALMSNPYLSRGAVWLSGAFAAVAKAAEGVGSKTKQKVELSEEGKEGSKTKENVEKSEDGKDESKTKDKVLEAGENEGSKTKDKVQEAEEEKEGLKTQEKVQETDEKEAPNKEKTNTVNDQAQIQVDESSKKDSPEIPPATSSNDNNNPKQ